MLSTLNQTTATPRAPRPTHKFNANVYVELKICVATQCFFLFSTKDLNAKNQESKASEYYHGRGAVASQLDLALEGKGKYANLFLTEPSMDDGRNVLVVPEELHRQQDKRLAARSDNLQKTHLQTSRGNNLMSGRTIRNYAREGLSEARKMISLIDEAVGKKILKKVGEEYEFDSGKTESDLNDFILYRMFNWKHYNGATTEAGEVAINTAADTVLDDNEVPSDVERELDGVEMESPPHDYLPKGWMLFKTRGPMADPDFRLDTICFEQLEDYITINGGRSSDRAKSAKEKADQRDFEVGNTVDPRQQRGIPFGGATQLEIASVAQNQARISNEEFQGEMVRHDLVMKSKGERIKTLMDMAKLSFQLEDVEDAKNHMAEAKTLSAEIKLLENSLLSLKKRKGEEEGVEVNEYLKRGRMAMGIQQPVTQQLATVQATPNNVSTIAQPETSLPALPVNSELGTTSDEWEDQDIMPRTLV